MAVVIPAGTRRQFVSGSQYTYYSFRYVPRQRAGPHYYIRRNSARRRSAAAALLIRQLPMLKSAWLTILSLVSKRLSSNTSLITHVFFFVGGERTETTETVELTRTEPNSTQCCLAETEYLNEKCFCYIGCPATQRRNLIWKSRLVIHVPHSLGEIYSNQNT